MPALAAVLRLVPGVEAAAAEAIVDMGRTLNVGDVLVNGVDAVVLVLEGDVIFDLMTKPRLVNTLSTKPIGLPVEDRPVGSVSRSTKFGLTDNSFSLTPSPTPIFHV
jgi:hypothetical protein